MERCGGAAGTGPTPGGLPAIGPWLMTLPRFAVAGEIGGVARWPVLCESSIWPRNNYESIS